MKKRPQLRSVAESPITSQISSERTAEGEALMKEELDDLIKEQLRSYHEANLEKAIRAVLEERRSFYEVAKAFDVSRTTLRNRVFRINPNHQKYQRDWNRKYTQQELQQAVQAVYEKQLTQREAAET